MSSKEATSFRIPPVHGPPAEFDTRRSREFYRYYEPFEALYASRPTWVDLHDNDAVTRHRPISSPDKALTAFCQLLAIKMQAQRALVMCFDAKQGYVLAEATKSLSLRRHECMSDGDGLWLGYATIPKHFAVCEHTVNLPANHSSNETTQPAASVHIINDLQEDLRFRNRPYVTSSPRARFYAGAPITTPRGTNIGALCVLDNQPRAGLTDGEIEFLTDMATTITEHLEAVRARAESKRGTQMTAGLSAFVQGMSTSVRLTEASVNSHNDMLARSPDNSTPKLRDGMSPSLEETVSIMEQKASEDGLEVERANPSTDFSSGHRNDTESSGKNKPFQLAASIIQNALNTDGVVFFDASVSTFGGLVSDADQNHTLADRQPFRSGSVEDFDCVESRSTDQCGERPSTPAGCEVLGESHKRNQRWQQGQTHRMMPERVLRSLLRKYPRGKIWCFNEGDAQAIPHDTSEPAVSSFRSPSRSASGQGESGHLPKEVKAFTECFPGVQSLVLVPMWDHAAERWRAGAFLFTYSPFRTFSYEGDVNFMTAFCDVITAELARGETEATLQAKTAFTSSISHELRTPLHGILGTVEHLRDELSTSFATRLLTQIERCGKVLLDVVNNLLAHSATSQGVAKQGPSSEVPQFTPNQPTGPSAAVSDKSLATVDAGLDEITEQVVDAIVYSYYCSYDYQQLHEDPITTVIDIDQAPSTGWQNPLPVGAWNRVCINLVNNALKFTSRGYVLVSLKQKAPSKSFPKPQAVFTVQDTGCGMSNDFMANSLFLAFTQEDSFVEGMGLGMSVATNIVRSVNGSIDVQSTPNGGTTVTVTVPLEPNVTSPERLPNGLAENIAQSLSGVTVCLLGNWDSSAQHLEERSRGLLRQAVKKSAEQLDMSVQLDDDSSSTAMLNVILECDLSWFRARIEQARKLGDEEQVRRLTETPLVIVCKTYFSARVLETSARGPTSRMNARVEYLAEPCGPSRLAATLSASLEPMDLQWPPASGGNSSTGGSNSPRVRHDSSKPSEITETMPFTDFTLCKACRVVPMVRSRLTADSGAPLTQSHNSDGARTPRTSLAKPHKQRREATMSLTMLLVDDNSVNLHLLDTYCRKKGHQSMTATDGQQAVELYKAAAATDVDGDMDTYYSIEAGRIIHHPKGWPQVILMDINMPIMDGFEATRQIRAFEKTTGATTHRSLIVAMTGVSSEEARQEAFVSGIDLFLQKPVKLKELTRVLDQTFQPVRG